MKFQYWDKNRNSDGCLFKVLSIEIRVIIPTYPLLGFWHIRAKGCSIQNFRKPIAHREKYIISIYNDKICYKSNRLKLISMIFKFLSWAFERLFEISVISRLFVILVISRLFDFSFDRLFKNLYIIQYFTWRVDFRSCFQILSQKIFWQHFWVLRRELENLPVSKLI